MSVRGHGYRDGHSGRSLRSHPGVGGVSFVALLQCSECPKVGEVKCRAVMPPDQIDQKFRQAGWAVDPHRCADCCRKPKEKPMSATPSPAAMKAQAHMFQLLSQHFDADNGRYVAGWSDDKIAKDTGISADLVKSFRKAGFGELKEPAEISLLRADINSVEQLAKEQHGAITAEVAALRAKLGKLTMRFDA